MHSHTLMRPPEQPLMVLELRSEYPAQVIADSGGNLALSCCGATRSLLDHGQFHSGVVCCFALLNQCEAKMKADESHAKPIGSLLEEIH